LEAPMGDHVWQVSVPVDVPAEQVWPVLLDVERWPTWTASMRDVTRQDDGLLEVGSTVRISQPLLPPTVWTVDELVPGRSFSWSSERSGTRTVADHRLDPRTGGCTVTLVLTQSGPLAGVSAVLFGRLVLKYMRMEAEGLKQRAEKGPAEMTR
jgi:uncharacterized membrane protein